MRQSFIFAIGLLIGFVVVVIVITTVASLLFVCFGSARSSYATVKRGRSCSA